MKAGLGALALQATKRLADALARASVVSLPAAPCLAAALPLLCRAAVEAAAPAPLCSSFPGPQLLAACCWLHAPAPLLCPCDIFMLCALRPLRPLCPQFYRRVRKALMELHYTLGEPSEVLWALGSCACPASAPEQLCLHC